jgi:NTP pyrophosphatase (non-canonical NTP hydrolase)
MSMPWDGLTFDELREANVRRHTTRWHPQPGRWRRLVDHLMRRLGYAPVKDWSPLEWSAAVAGEVGEACNLIKKLRRGEAIPPRDIAYELADAVIYIDLLAECLGIDLGGAIREKFNIVSERVGSNVQL